jgi:FixJ family two-component response regulator
LRETIYIIDDDPEFSGAVRRLLEMAGYRVLSFPSGETLLEQQFSKDRVACILLDVRLPALTGPELQQELIAHNIGCRLSSSRDMTTSRPRYAPSNPAPKTS